MALPASQIFDEGKYQGDWLKWEEDGYFSRQEVTILAGSGTERALTSGMVMGKITTGGKYIQVSALSDGSENAAGILLCDVTAPVGSDVQGVIIARDAVVTDNGITWPSGYDTAAGITALAALGILVREGA